ncbi:helix-turn-helix domain-containing protein [Kitasatospora purpeofusca]|uniref:helix-turn-helix domain-containing protein n=1 Tax=Kitasatospora purpeofusca TaxID=67352 RepID=UPI00382FEB73
MQQARLIHAVTLLAADTPVTTVASALDYAAPSAFTAMFHRALGVPPSGWFAPSSEGT